MNIHIHLANVVPDIYVVEIKVGREGRNGGKEDGRERQREGRGECRKGRKGRGRE